MDEPKAAPEWQAISDEAVREWDGNEEERKIVCDWFETKWEQRQGRRLRRALLRLRPFLFHFLHNFRG
jgi:hypothetical protein